MCGADAAAFDSALRTDCRYRQRVIMSASRGKDDRQCLALLVVVSWNAAE